MFGFACSFSDGFVQSCTVAVFVLRGESVHVQQSCFYFQTLRDWWVGGVSLNVSQV